MLTKDQKRENAEERRLIKLEEAATATADVLELNKCDRPGVVMNCATLWELIPPRAEVNRKKDTRNSGSYRYEPTVNNRVVQSPSESFCRNNWRDIKLFAAEYGYYVVSRLPGEPLGVRLGSEEEYERCQSQYKAGALGWADTYNERAETLEKNTGKDLPEMIVRIREFIDRKESES
jgi:hypothetical protein